MGLFSTDSGENGETTDKNFNLTSDGQDLKDRLQKTTTVREAIYGKTEEDLSFGEVVGKVAAGSKGTHTSKEILEILDRDEVPEYVLPGNFLIIQTENGEEKYSGKVTTVLSDKRIFTLTEGLGFLQTGDLKILPYDTITSVEYGAPPDDDFQTGIPLGPKLGFRTKKLIIQTPDKTYYIDHDEKVAENANDDFAMEVINFIRKKRREVNEPTRSNIKMEADALDKLERLKDLKDDGVITEEEFEEKKQELLEEM